MGDEVRSGWGGGVFGAARVVRVHRSVRFDGVAVRTAGGRFLVSTPDHVHFAGHGQVVGSNACYAEEISHDLLPGPAFGMTATVERERIAVTAEARIAGGQGKSVGAGLIDGRGATER